ncbi:MAG: SpoIIE family protein phosphatase [Calditrichaceae bacterium]|nr:SpoIIE family protein phosphatase [Calditrichaceae bacterium]MBN2709291.1 SpoIIE family protein phosphatase [Calditrichaceae bacterium]RQV91987.1 MAG: hypothetical protein EH224_16805 [Calditrichota bacterium]
METTRFRIQKRTTDSYSQIQKNHLSVKDLYFYAGGWWFSFYFLLGSFTLNFYWTFLWTALSIYFLIKITRITLEVFRIPDELPLILLVLLVGLDYWLWSSIIYSDSVFPEFYYLSAIIHFSLLAFICLSLALLIGSNSKQKVGSLIFYIILFIVGHYYIFNYPGLLFYLYLLILFFSILKKTVWLEKLTRTELITYFFIILIIFINFLKIDASDIIWQSNEKLDVSWISLPVFVFCLFRLYLLAFLVKIPLVLIYNHASLSRKLRISGLFQSTFPQLIQFIALFYIFYLFVSGWQADTLRRSVIDCLFNEQTKLNDIGYKIKDLHPETDIVIKPEDHVPVNLPADAPAEGIIRIEKTGDDNPKSYNYFYYFKQAKPESSIILAPINQELLLNIIREFKPMVGDRIAAYTYQSSYLQKYADNIGLTDSEHHIHVKPFHLMEPFYKGDNFITEARFNEKSRGEKNKFRIGSVNLSESGFIIGRIIIPIVNLPPDDYTEMTIAVLFDPVSLFQWNFMTRAILILFLAYFLINIFIISRVSEFGEQINKTIVEKFDILKTGIREISTGNLDYKVHLEGEDEFVELGQRFNQMGFTIQKQIDELREKDRLDHELKIARQVQLGLLPEKLPKINNYNLSAAFRTATEVGGDFYDVIPLQDQKYLFTIGDVSGKGSSAAFYMAQYMSLFRYSHQYSLKPEEIAARLNAHFFEYIADKQIFITAIIGLLDAGKNTIDLVRAGHTPPVVVPASVSGKIKELKPSGMGLGLADSDGLFTRSLKNQKVTLKQNEMLVLYTDGIIEASFTDEQEKSEIFGEERFYNFLDKQKGASAALLIESLSFELEKFQQGRPLTDDYTVLVLQKTT